MKALTPQIRDETDRLIDDFIEQGAGDLAEVAWRQPGIVFFKYLLGMPIEDVPLCIELTDTRLNGDTEEARMAAWGGLYQHIHDAVSARIDSATAGRHDRCPSRGRDRRRETAFADVVVQRDASGPGRSRNHSERNVVRVPLSRNASRRARPAHPRARNHAARHRGIDPLRRVHSRHPANRRQGSRAQRPNLLPRRIGPGQLRLGQSRRRRVSRP